ncbi:hypothetical protein L873DRAFT_1793746 [Choiromyces venosus 120613-1]|uniref:Uncharacterized protein n=1 Tax=Choiromyces venosus 120613-1 TaxID=1336337 RepID=A0A3N4JA49_9PEZI|nr:hypothetical protein L873DRAFT_1793746 [Choiromyces venosus 120613-1]
MADCWCGEDAGEYLGRMDACLSTCDQAVSNRSVQRDQMVRYREIVCEKQNGKTVVTDTLFAEYWKTRFQSKGENFLPAVTEGIPPPTAEPVGITSTDTQVPTSDVISPPTGIPGTSSGSNETANPVSPSLTPPSLTPPPVTSTPTVSSSLSSSSLIMPTASHNFTATGNSPTPSVEPEPKPTSAPSVLSSFPSESRLTIGQLAAVIVSCVLGSLLLVLSIVFCRRRRVNSKPFSFLPTRPRFRPRPRVITTPQQSWWSRNIEAALNHPQSPISSILPRHYRPKPYTPPATQQNFPPSLQTYGHTIIPIPPSPSSRSSSTRILTLSTTTRSRSRDRISEHTIIEPQPQETLTEISTTRLSVASSHCDYSSTSCSSWSERSWVENDDPGWRR